MTSRLNDHLSHELEALGREFGHDKAENARRAFAEVARWLRQTGHGDVRLSAVGHKLSSKVRFDSVVDLDRAGP